MLELVHQDFKIVFLKTVKDLKEKMDQIDEQMETPQQRNGNKPLKGNSRPNPYTISKVKNSLGRLKS